VEILTRAKPATKPDIWSDYWFTAPSYTASSGVEVDEDKAMRYSAVWACVKVISEDLASLPLFVYQRRGNGKERAIDHPLYRILHDAPNPEMSAMSFREALEAHVLTYGNAYAEIQRNLRGQVVGLWPLDPARMTIDRDENNELEYEYSLTDGGKKIFRKEDILHVPGLGFNGLVGYSPIAYQMEAIGVGLAGQEFQGNNLKSGGRLQLAFIHPAPKAPTEEGRKAFRDAIRKEYGGPTGQKIGVFWEGMEPKTISMTPEEAEFIDSRKFSRTEICAIFRVPPHKIMDLERATFSNIEQQSISYVIDTIRPWCVRWEQAMNQRLLGNSSEYFCEHLIDGLMRGDIASRYQAYATGRQWGWLNADEIRTLENMNPLPDGQGQKYLVPMNMIPADQMEKIPGLQEPISEEEKERAALMIRKLILIKGGA